MARQPVKKQTRATQNSAPAITAEMTEQMAIYRHDDLVTYNRELKLEDFNSEEEYRKALLDQYENLRLEEYKYTVRNETLKAYNLSCDGRSAGINPNNAWGGYHEYPQFLKQHIEHADSAQVQQFPELITNPRYMNTFKNVKKDGTVKSVGAYTCAVTSTALQMQISDKMGYEGTSNIVVDGKCCASAVNAATCVPQKYQLEGDGKKTLNQMILSGEIGVGDEVSIYPKPDNKKKDNTVVTASGKHCITIASINRNEKGEIVGFTYQANNMEAFRDVSVNDSSGQGTKLVYNAVKTHEWINDKISEERTKLNQKTTEELAAEVSGVRQRTGELIDNLQKTEQYAATHKKANRQNYFTDAKDSYRQELAKRKNSYDIRRIEPAIIKPTKSVITIPTLEELDASILNTRIGFETTFKGQRFESKTEEKKKIEEARQENERSASPKQEPKKQEEYKTPESLKRPEEHANLSLNIWQKKRGRNG